MRATYILAAASGAAGVLAQQPTGTCRGETQYLSTPPHENYFYTDCNVTAQVVVSNSAWATGKRSPGPRLVIAWPAGNSGAALFFGPDGGKNGTIVAMHLVTNSTSNNSSGTLMAASGKPSADGYPARGVSGRLMFNTSTTLTTTILGSVRTIRDFTEGDRAPPKLISDALRIRALGSGVELSRLWLDNKTTTVVTLMPVPGRGSSVRIANGADGKPLVTLAAGQYDFTATVNYPQLTPLPRAALFNNQSQALVSKRPSEAAALAFLSYTEKLLAGGWRFLTYFGRDSMLAALLLEPVLATGAGSAAEVVIGAALERIDRRDGSVSHEEVIGDYATWLNLEQGNKTANGSSSSINTAARFDYAMIDTDLYLPILMERYFTANPTRVTAVLGRKAGSVNVANANLTWGDLALRNAQKIMNITAPFAANRTRANLLRLKPGQVVGQWRDSTYGLGGGRVPFDVNTALVPAALRAIAALANIDGVYGPRGGGNTTGLSPMVVRSNAVAWEQNTLRFFETNRTAATARQRVQNFAQRSLFYTGPSQADTLPAAAGNTSVVTDYALALDGFDGLDQVDVMHSDTAFRLFFINATTSASSAAEAEELRFLNATAQNVLRPFPAGLNTPLGMVVANPALSAAASLTANFTNAAYHGTVIWSWQLALMAKGLERQIARCGVLPPKNGNGNNSTMTSASNVISITTRSNIPSSVTTGVGSTSFIATTTTRNGTTIRPSSVVSSTVSTTTKGGNSTSFGTGITTSTISKNSTTLTTRSSAASSTMSNTTKTSVFSSSTTRVGNATSMSTSISTSISTSMSSSLSIPSTSKSTSGTSMSSSLSIPSTSKTSSLPASTRIISPTTSSVVPSTTSLTSTSTSTSASTSTSRITRTTTAVLTVTVTSRRTVTGTLSPSIPTTTRQINARGEELLDENNNGHGNGHGHGHGKSKKSSSSSSSSTATSISPSLSSSSSSFYSSTTPTFSTVSTTTTRTNSTTSGGPSGSTSVTSTPTTTTTITTAPPTAAPTAPAWCSAPGNGSSNQEAVVQTMRRAYNALWDTIEANSARLQTEVWSWRYDARAGRFVAAALDELPPPPGVQAPTEFNARQLWSLAFLGVQRNPLI